ncbi:FecCD family ABC transporter permease [Tropicimonas sp.]|uniref:FecCD family ABC transporter permease n=1 Tax=Tropicimonas sp. TaxID=2067044 RepID=UPI003A8B67C6
MRRGGVAPLPLGLGLLVAITALSLWSMGVGAAPIPAARLIEALADPGGQSRETLIVWTVRLPRLLAALLAGAALAGAGTIMQAVTGNPLADPGLLGVNAGAAFAVVLVLVLTGTISGHVLVWAAFAGALLAATAVYGLGAAGRSGPTPLKLILAGVVVGTFLGAITMSLLILDAQTFDQARLWTAGSLKGRGMESILPVLPYFSAGLICALLLRDQFTTLSLGEAAARGIGQNPALWRAISALVVVLLAGSAVAVAGPVGFVGLVVPHMIRLTVGADYGRILPLAIPAGALLTLLADTAPRALWGNDVPLGVTLGLVGAPVFLWLARRRAGRPA